MSIKILKPIIKPIGREIQINSWRLSAVKVFLTDTPIVEIQFAEEFVNDVSGQTDTLNFEKLILTGAAALAFISPYITDLKNDAITEAKIKGLIPIEARAATIIK